MNANYVPARDKVTELLRNCADEKLIRGRGINVAVELAREAYEVASTDNLLKPLLRINNAVQSLSGRPKLKVFKPNSDPVTLTGEITVFGAVHAQTLKRRRAAR